MAGSEFTVSYSQWINPYTGASTGGQAFYSTTSQQPVVRRLAPPAPAYSFRLPGVSYSYGDSKGEVVEKEEEEEEKEEEEEEESGMIASRHPDSSP